MKPTLPLVISLLLCHQLVAQHTIRGVVTAEDNSPLPGVNIVIKGTDQGTITDGNGSYSISTSPNAIIVFSYIGYATQEVAMNGNAEVDLILKEDKSELAELIVVGSRSGGRTKLSTPAPVDVISIKEIMGDMPQMDLAQMLAAVAPSFNAVRSQGGDLNSHVDPAQLRNMAPNQTLLLINGKRRHSAALLIINTAVGSPSTSTDMMMIPTTAIERVEILRDGAAAQYGSDAIAGVINIVLKKGTGEFNGTLTTGGFLNSGGDAPDLTLKGNPDGFNYQLSANYGFDFEEKGYLNLSAELNQRQATVRPYVNDWTAYDDTYLNNERTDKLGNPIITNPELIDAMATGDEAMISNLKTEEGLLAARGYTKGDVTAVYAGQPAITGGTLFYNLGAKISDNLEVYGFGGLSYKYLEGFSCYYRRAAQTDRFDFLLYPNGFRPQITSNQNDISTTLGVKGQLGTFAVDFSNTYGRNSMRFGMINTLNASLGSNSPVDMNLGTHSFSQNSTNLDFSKYYKTILKGFNLAFGMEMRVEQYQIHAGQEESYSLGNAGIVTAPSDDFALIGPDGQPLEDRNGEPIVDASGNPLVLNFGQEYTVKGFSPNCQCFRGFGPDNERNAFRSNISAYLDTELDLSEALLLTAAARLENFSDFGSVVTGKFSARYSLLRNLAFRGSISTGFRAPSLQELNYTHTFTYFVADETGNLVPVDGTTYPTNSTAARAIGIQELSEEKSTSISAGFTTKITPQLELTVDAYQIDVRDRIFNTRTFTAAEVGNNYEEVIGDGEASFFINGADVRSQGLEVVANYKTNLNLSTLTLTLAGTFNKNEILSINVPDLNIANLSDEEITSRYLSRDVEGQFRTGTPREKVIFSALFSRGKFSSMLRSTYYGEVSSRARDLSGPEPNRYYADQTFSAQTVMDLSVTYTPNEHLRFTIGGNNILDSYPDILREENRGFYLYSNYQQGSAGAYYFGRVAITL